MCLLSRFSLVRLFATLWTSPPGSPVHGIPHWIRSPVQGIFPTQGSNPCLLRLLHCRRILYRWASWEAGTEITVSNFDVGGGNGTPLQYSCLENPMDGGAWKAVVHGVAEGQTRLSDFNFTFTHWRRKWQPTPVFLPGESQGRGSLVGCCLWGRTELDTTEAT